MFEDVGVLCVCVGVGGVALFGSFTTAFCFSELSPPV